MIKLIDNVPSLYCTTASIGVGNLYASPIDLPESLSFHSYMMPFIYRATATQTRANSTERCTYTLYETFSFSLGIYSLNGSTLSLYTNHLASWFLSQAWIISSGTATSAVRSFYGSLWLAGEIPTVTLTKGQWYLGYIGSSNVIVSQSYTNTLDVTSSTYSVSTSAATISLNVKNVLELSSIVGMPFYAGSLSTTTSSMPASIHVTDMVHCSTKLIFPYIVLGS